MPFLRRGRQSHRPQPHLRSRHLDRLRRDGFGLLSDRPAEARVALEEVVAHVADYDVDEAGATRVHSVNVRGFATLPTKPDKKQTS